MLVIEEKKCLLCAGCPALCPESALHIDLKGLRVDHDKCTLCRICLKFCPVAALSIAYDDIGHKTD
jgi:ferredoxin